MSEPSVWLIEKVNNKIWRPVDGEPCFTDKITALRSVPIPEYSYEYPEYRASEYVRRSNEP